MFSSCKVLSVEINPRFPISSLVQFSCTGATRMTRPLCVEKRSISTSASRVSSFGLDTRPRAFVFRRTRRSTRPASRFRDSSRVTPSRTRSAAASARVERVWSCCSPEDTSRSSPLSRHEVQGGADAPQGLRAPHQGVQRGTRRPPAARRSPRSRGIVRTTCRSGPDESAPRVLTGRFPRDFGRLLLLRRVATFRAREGKSF